MKNLILFFAITLFNYAIAQSGKDVYAFNPNQLKNNVLAAFDHANVVAEKEINAATIKNFSKKFKDAIAPQWFNTAQNEAMCRFYQQGILTMAYYKTNGLLLAYVCRYQEDGIPQDIADQVYASYPSFTISLAHEICFSTGDKVYIVNIEHHNLLKVLRVMGDQIDVLQDLKK
jgi:hypothetical protein